MIDDSFWSHLAQEGWASSDLALPAELWLSWAQSLEHKFGEGHLRPAMVTSSKFPDQIRGDHLLWLDEDRSSEARQAELWLENLRLQLNQNLFLALKRFEAHWTFYPAGRAYDWHVDQHQTHDHRRISFILYLNSSWNEDDGGELELRPDATPRVKKWSPIGGRLVLFRSEKFPHRVLPARTSRKSLTAWFRDDD